MSVDEQSILDGINAIRSGQKFSNYMKEYDGPEDPDELSLAIRCRIVEDYSDDDILAYINSVESHMSGLPNGPGKDRFQAVLDALNIEKMEREI